ncbi:uncharacterized protein YbbC (DUF1343 family) [Paenibacillus rhizosphaerae]|uniref:Uncharacterized protein YbbC (DUF1343 family) n=1 Tax=Paenibacillus rhizosphaerae TaxID=297318 RepID=A0A839TFB5_9BACL|nr:DUF1343 domain-containing protein [Paenibacillus rhizosphaerae]MBB3125391.1 uncharacterized protein YbbC (DUF1343 family) [Paenibacillus rhizosphaerae]
MSTMVLTGADMLAGEAGQILKGKKFGLLTNPTGIDSCYRSTIEICESLPGAELKALFGCEHGIRGDRQAGVKFEEEVDPETGHTVHSLYGKHRAPTAEMLEPLDAIVFDIQDLGVRFYTYLSTLVYVMQACAEHGVEVIVLDRPNPMGSFGAEGGYLREGFYSMVGAWRIPFTTGLTIGEFATFVCSQMEKPCALHVVRLEGWKRDMAYTDTGLPWVLPSPNMPTMDTVRVYPGNCLFEGTNLSEGRGTTRPFEMIGAPWLRHRELCVEMNAMNLPGVVFHPITFTPVISKHRGELCNGVMTFVTDKSAYESAATGLRLIERIMRLHPDEFAWVKPAEAESGWFIDVLSGSDRVRKTLHHEGELDAILADWRADSLDWMTVRQSSLLYD